MGEGTRYDVVLALSTTGNLNASIGALGQKASDAHGKIGALGEGAKEMGEKIASMGERVGGFLEGIADKAIDAGVHLAKIGALAIGGVAAYGVAHLNRELEETKISLGAIAQAQGFAQTFEQGFAQAGDQLQKMKQDVKALPGDLGQLANIMKQIATPAAQGGASMDDIRKLSGKAMLTGAILGIDQETTARQMGMLLAGRAGAHNTLGARMGLAGDSAKAFNEMSADKRLARVQSELAKYDGAANRFGQSFTANWTTLKDNLKYGFIAEATEPLFERVKRSIAEVNTYFDEHKDKIKEIANTVGTRLAEGWDRIEAIVKRVGPLVGKIADHILHMQLDDIGGRLKKAGELAIGTKLVGAGLSAGASAIPGLMGLMGGGAGAAEVGGIAAVAPEAAAAIGVLAVAAVPVAGAFDNLTNSLSRYHDEDMALAKQLGEKMTELGPPLEQLGDKARYAADYLGHEFMVGLNAAAGWLITFGSNLKQAGEGLDTLIGVLAYGYDKMLGKRVFDLSKDPMGPIKEHEFGGLGALASAMKTGGNQDATSEANKVKTRAAPTTNVQKVEIVISGSGDPSRVARLTLDAIKNLGRNPTASPYVPNYASAR